MSKAATRSPARFRFRCDNTQEQSHFASNAPDREKLGVI
jgi:hypothetical protein